MRSVRVGFIGLGSKGKKHLWEVSRQEGAQIAAVCDINADLVAEIGREYGVTSYTSHREMLEKEKMDALYIVVPPFAHSDAEIMAAERGIHLFMEKPVVLDIDKGLQILEAVEKAGIITCVGYHWRYMKSIAWAQQFIAERTVAMIVSAHWRAVHELPWWWVMDRSGGQVFEQGTHQVDLARYLTDDEITEVYAQYAQRVKSDSNYENFDIPDVYALTFRTRSGVIGSFTSSCTLNKGGHRIVHDVLLDEDQRLHFDRDGSVTVYPEPGERMAFEERSNIAEAIDDAFIKAVRTGDRSHIRSEFRDGLITCSVTMAANESARTGQPVVPYFAR